MRRHRVFFFAQENTLGYGSVYWLWYAAACRLPVNELLVMRGLALACTLTIPVVLVWYARGTGGPFAWGALLLWLTTPMAWWTGKLTGPELPALATGMVGLMFYQGDSGRRRWFGGTLIGAALGIKVTAIAVLVFVAALSLRGPKRLHRLAPLGFGVVGGFLLTNPFILTNPVAFVANLTQEAPPPAEPLHHLRLVLLHHGNHWDGVYNGGLCFFGIGQVSLFVLGFALVAGRCPFRYFLGILASFAVLLLMLFKSEQYMGWYWFSFIPLLPLLLSALPRTERPAHRPMAALVLLAVLGNLYQQLPIIREQLRWKYHHIASVRYQTHVAKTIDRVVASLKERPVFAVDFTYYDMDLDVESVPLVRKHHAPVWVEQVLEGSVRDRNTEIGSILMFVTPGLQHNSGVFSTSAVFRPRTRENPAGYDSLLYYDSFVHIYMYWVSLLPSLDGWASDGRVVYGKAFQQLYLTPERRATLIQGSASQSQKDGL